MYLHVAGYIYNTVSLLGHYSAQYVQIKTPIVLQTDSWCSCAPAVLLWSQSEFFSWNSEKVSFSFLWKHLSLFFLSWRLQLDDVRKRLRVLLHNECVMLHEKDEHMFLVLILVFWCFPCLGLNKHVSSLWTCVSGLNDTVIRHGGLLDFIQDGQDDIHSRVKNLNSSLNQVSRDLQSLSEHDLTGELLLPLILFVGVFSYSVISQHSSALIWITWKEGCRVFIGLMYWLCLGDHQSLQQCSQTDVDLLD